MQKITQKEYKKEFKEIKDHFNLKFYGDIKRKNSIKTKWGIYNFFFDNDSIFGRFEDLKINELPPEIQNAKNGFFKISSSLGLQLIFPSFFSLLSKRNKSNSIL